MRFDLMNNLALKPCLPPVAARTDNTAMVGTVLDTQGLTAVALIIVLGANTDANATFAVLIEESNISNSNFTAVADAQLNGTEALAGFTAADDDNELRKIGYIGSKRYVRATITPTGNDSGNIFLAALWAGTPMDAPAPNPPT